MTLYLKYRPQTIFELDSEQARSRLLEIVNSGNIPHAFLFSGPRGVGKTSAARILAKAINCEKNKDKPAEPCNECEACLKISKGNHMDVVELDAASHRGIDDIRALRENIALAPSSAVKKIYILDEAHMLTLEAANAFLKTLEEPPPHVIFILATTDPQKLPSTIRSRLTTIHFNYASEKEITRQLKRIAKGEKIKLDDQVFKLIAQVSDGSFRDAAKNLETLLVAGMPTDIVEIKKILQGSSGVSDKLLIALSRGYTQEALEVVRAYSEANGSIKELVDLLIGQLRDQLLGFYLQQKPAFDLDSVKTRALINLLFEARNNLRLSPIASLPLEIAIITFTERKDSKVSGSAPNGENKNNGEGEKENSKKLSEGQNLWGQILSEASGKNTTIEALLRSAHLLGFDGEHLKVGVYYRFHKEQLEMQKNRLEFEQICSNILGPKVRISYEVTERREVLPTKDEPPLTEACDDDIIQAAKEIFGS